jgi:hypothetical protein
MMKPWTILTSILILAILVVGCSRNPILIGYEKPDMMKFNDIIYGAIYQPEPVPANGHELTFYDSVKRNNGQVILNGDAEGLAAGTTVYTYDGYAPAFRLAVKHGEELIVFQPEYSRKDAKAGDMLDIAGKVERIEIQVAEEYDNRFSISDKSLIDRLVGMIVDAPYSGEVLMNPGVKAIRLTFYLTDGTKVLQAVWLDSGVMGTNIQLPVEFCDALTALLADNTTALE